MKIDIFGWKSRTLSKITLATNHTKYTQCHNTTFNVLFTETFRQALPLFYEMFVVFAHLNDKRKKSERRWNFVCWTKLNCAIYCVGNKLLLCCQEDVRTSRFDASFIQLIDQLFLFSSQMGQNYGATNNRRKNNSQQFTMNFQVVGRNRKMFAWNVVQKTGKRIIVTTRKWSNKLSWQLK